MLMTLDQATRTYVALRDSISLEDEAHKTKMAPKRQALTDLNTWLLGQLQTLGVDSIASEFGTVYTTHKKSASLEDAQAFHKYVKETGEWELADIRANSTAVEDYVKNKGTLPPGVKFTSTDVVGVRRPS